jgi:flagellar basal body rod protein FlgG
MSVSSAALSGLNQAQATFENAAKRIGSAGLPGDSVDLTAAAVDLIQAKNDFEANLKSLTVADELDKSAIDLVA